MRVGRQEDGLIYHFTGASTFLNFIGPYAQLRLAPFSQSFDPRERLPVSFGLGIAEGSFGEAEHGQWMKAQDQLTDLIRNKAHMLCFSNSYSPLCPAMQWDHEGDRGWAQSAMWAHFADRHAGVCLEIDKASLLLNLAAATAGKATVLTGDVFYMGSGDAPLHLPNLTVDTMTSDTSQLMFGHVLHNSIAPFFRKDQCWAYEQEFRAVALNSCGEPVYIPLGDSLRAVILGDRFPDDLVPVISWVIEKAGFRAEVRRMSWLPGPFSVGPFPIEGAGSRDSSVRAVDEHGSFGVATHPDPRHAHDNSCNVLTAYEPSRTDRLSSWRESLLEAYRRRLARSLEAVCAESRLGFSIRNIPGYLSVAGDATAVSIDQINVYSHVDERLMTVRFAASYALEDSDTRVIQLEWETHDRPLLTRQWHIPDESPDSAIMNIFYELDSTVNDALAPVLQSRVP